MMEDKAQMNIDDVVKNETTIKDIINSIVQNFVTLIIVCAVVYLALHNNAVDVLKNAFEVIIGYYIGTRQIGK